MIPPTSRSSRSDPPTFAMQSHVKYQQQLGDVSAAPSRRRREVTGRLRQSKPQVAVPLADGDRHKHIDGASEPWAQAREVLAWPVQISFAAPKRAGACDAERPINAGSRP